MGIRKSLLVLAGVSVAMLVSPPSTFARDTLQPAQGGSIARHKDGDWSYRSGRVKRKTRDRDWGQRSGKGWDRKAEVVGKKHHGGLKGLPGVSGDGALPDYIRNLGTFSGSISAVRERKNGIYFYRDRTNVGGMKILSAPSPKGPKIIGVTPESFEAACDSQGSVCVIKPR